ncbi:MAG TPA: aminotransferase class V-fold PLP-dependent enzyme [Thermoanaerobaculia bacterium]|nr:aminotransferase class V-fold PLP-dependent enzyme [Thermoanaerobaculia bacterium]
MPGRGDGARARGSRAGRIVGGDFRELFGDFEGRVWLNTAHQGPLPEPAVAEAEEAIAWKRAPQHLVGRRFHEVPARLRRAVAALLGVSADDVVVTNGASYGVHLLANGLPLGPGDEVLVMAGDFPSNILPWLGLADRGVTVRRLTSRRGRPVVEPDDLAEALGAPGAGRPRVLCLSWVHSFTGHATDVAALGSLCRARGVAFVVNTTQGLGARRLDLPSLPVDAVVNAGWKWLCGPYGTGFCWLRPELRERLTVNRRYWLASRTADDLQDSGGGEEEAFPDPATLGARRLDAFATASFFNVKPFAAAVETLLAAGLERIEAHDRALVDRLIDGLARERWRLVSPEAPAERSPIVVFSHREPGRNREVFEHLRAAGLDVALRRGNLRVSPHLHNRAGDIERLLELLESFADG